MFGILTLYINIIIIEYKFIQQKSIVTLKDTKQFLKKVYENL